MIKKTIAVVLVVSFNPTEYSNEPATETHSWWRHQMETFSALLAVCAGNSPVAGEFPAQRPVTRSLDDFFDLRLHKRLSKQSWGWWFETLSPHYDVTVMVYIDRNTEALLHSANGHQRNHKVNQAGNQRTTAAISIMIMVLIMVLILIQMLILIILILILILMVRMMIMYQ